MHTQEEPPPSPKGVFIIAEAGVNHNGALPLALRLVEVAAASGADAIKFQTFRSTELVSRNAPKAAYQRLNTAEEESQWEMLRRLELDWPSHHRLLAHCREMGIRFLSAPFDPPSLDFLLDELHLPQIKIPSGEITNGPLLWRVGSRRRQVILSTGMATLGEVEQALGVLACGYLGHPPSAAAFEAAYRSGSGQQLLRDNVVLLHCTSEYPAPFDSVNLRAMDTLASAFGLPVGLSDHSPGSAVAIAAVARGAILVEKHFTLDRSLPGPDHKASLEPLELAAMVEGIRAVELALGDGRKVATAVELNNRPVVRKRLVALTDIAPGTLFTEDNLGAKRPGDGLSPMEYWRWLGRRAERAYQADQPIVDT
ncbi:MAG: N-acetylneuraminate synthase [Magnetococcales bacterium]|nr:N-acetylneuraminate synthase [Magnetococcales bacterium]